MFSPSSTSTQPMGYTIPSSSYDKILRDSPDKISPQAIHTPPLSACAATIAENLFASLLQNQGSRYELLDCLKAHQIRGNPNPFLQVETDENTFQNVDLRSLAALNVQKQPQNPDNWETLSKAIGNNEFVYMPIEGHTKTMYNKLDCLIMAQNLRVEMIESFEISSQILNTTWNRVLQGKAFADDWLLLSKTLLRLDEKNQQTRTYANDLSEQPDIAFTALECAIQAIMLKPQEQAYEQQMFNCLSTGENLLFQAANTMGFMK